MCHSWLFVLLIAPFQSALNPLKFVLKYQILQPLLRLFFYSPISITGQAAAVLLLRCWGKPYPLGVPFKELLPFRQEL